MRITGNLQFNFLEAERVRQIPRFSVSYFLHAGKKSIYSMAVIIGVGFMVVIERFLID